ncbi:MAG: hypothetical protein ACFFCQ_05135, partial [Promethearchaeota archaeon]
MTSELLNRLYNGAEKIRENIEVVDETSIELFLSIRGKRTCILKIGYFAEDDKWVDMQPQVSFPKGVFVRAMLFPFQGVAHLLSLLIESPDFPQKQFLLQTLQECHNLSEKRKEDRYQFFPTPD